MAKLWGHVYDEPPALADARPGLAPALDDVLRRALAKEPSERYPSAGDLGRAAVAAVEGRRIAEPERSVAVGEALRPLPPRPPVLPRRRTRSRALAAGAAVALAVGAGVLAGWAAFGRSEPETAASAPPEPPSIEAAPPAEEPVGSTIYLGSAVDALFAIDAGEGAVFATAARDREDGIREQGLYRVDPAVDQVVGPPVWFYEEFGLDLYDLAVGEGAAWVLARTYYTGENADEVEFGVVRVDPSSGELDDPIVLARGFSVESVIGVTAGEGSVWAMGVASGAEPEKGPAVFLHQIDPATATVVQRLRVPLSGATFDAFPGQPAVGGGSIWIPVANVGDPAGSVLLRVDPATGEVADPIDLGPTPVFECVYAGSMVWLLSSDHSLLRVDAELGQVVGTPMTYGSGELIGFAATDAEGAWALESRDGQGYLWRLDPTTGETIGEAVPVGGAPGALGVGEGAVWVGTGRSTIVRIDVPAP
jgi:serine/threonine-protein kinase